MQSGARGAPARSAGAVSVIPPSPPVKEKTSIISVLQRERPMVQLVRRDANPRRGSTPRFLSVVAARGGIEIQSGARGAPARSAGVVSVIPPSPPPGPSRHDSAGGKLEDDACPPLGEAGHPQARRARSFSGRRDSGPMQQKRVNRVRP